uniref:SCP domain-containing protein n=1 Tax=Elaeophora elaphi TaxID=1147741 RepID=A0A0R3RW57_9BILA
LANLEILSFVFYPIITGIGKDKQKLKWLAFAAIKNKDNNDSCIIGDKQLIVKSDANNDSHSNNASRMTLNENLPSPERPDTILSPTTAFLLKPISKTSQFYERIPRASGNAKNRFLNLPAPYHLLPDTPYFRRAPIIPPPTRESSSTRQMPIQQCIINHYLSSMKMDDENGFAAIERYERECYEQLYVSFSCYYPPHEHFGVRGFQKGTGRIEGNVYDTGSRVDMNTGKHIPSTNFFTASMANADYAKTFNHLANSTNGHNWSALVAPFNQRYKVWNCQPSWWTCNFNFKE